MPAFLQVSVFLVEFPSSLFTCLVSIDPLNEKDKSTVKGYINITVFSVLC